MYSGSISRAETAKLLTASDIAAEIKSEMPINDSSTTFIIRRKLVAFKFLCTANPSLALSITNIGSVFIRSILRRIWLIMINGSLIVSEVPERFQTKLAKIITGQFEGKLETEQLPYYIEAGNDLSQLAPTLMILETCVDVDRLPDLLRYLPQLDETKLRLVITRMINRFYHMKIQNPSYWRHCMYCEYLDFFRRFITRPDILSFGQIETLQALTDNEFLGIAGVDCWRMLLYRCNQRTITRILGLPLTSSLEIIKIALEILRTIGIEAYYRQLYRHFSVSLPKVRNVTDLCFVDFWEYHPDDLIVIDNYMFTGPEYNSLLTSMQNPYTRQPIPEAALQEIRLKIPQPTETPKELCIRFTS